MRILSRFQHQPKLTTSEITDIQRRVRAMRSQVGDGGLELPDLFSLLAEYERPVLRQGEQVKSPELQRLWPDQVPARPMPSVEASAPEMTCSDWELLRRKGVVTLP